MNKKKYKNIEQALCVSPTYEEIAEIREKQLINDIIDNMIELAKSAVDGVAIDDASKDELMDMVMKELSKRIQS